MWIPSFISVLHDLWCFVLRQEAVSTPGVTIVSASNNPALQQRPVRQQPILVQEKTVQRSPETVLADGGMYTSESIETLSIRSKLRAKGLQTSTAGNLRLGEWLAYKICFVNDSISPIALLMTPIGRWHQTLKGTAGVQIGISPSTGSLAEWFDKKLQGHSGIVLRVTPTNEITVGTVSQNPEGTYQETVFSAAQWKERGAVFTRFRS